MSESPASQARQFARIATLEAENARLRAALTKIVEMEPKKPVDNQYMAGWSAARYRALMVAREALGE